MIHIAICDDDPKELQTLTALFHAYREERPTPLHLHTFENGFSLLDAIEGGEWFDIAVLDIIMPGVNGMEIAREIRKAQSDMGIIFLTSSPEYAVDSYEVQAQNYLLKPVPKDKFFSAMDRMLEQLNRKENAGFIVYSSLRQYTRITFSQLVYAEAQRKSVILYLADHTTVSSVMTLTELLSILEAQPDFVRPHRSYVVNMNFIRYVNKNDICLLDGSSIPLSRSNYSMVSKRFLDFVCSVSFDK